MEFEIDCTGLSYSVNERQILNDLTFSVPKGAFVAVLGENGAGKTTLIDLILGFRKASAGNLKVFGQDASKDLWEARAKIAYLSERVDVPGDWTAKDFLDFHSYFYKGTYSSTRELELIQSFKVDFDKRFNMMSAGEIRRAQIVGAIAAQPSLILVDEITGVLDIVGRHKFMAELRSLNRSREITVLLATNILEDLADSASHVMIIKGGLCGKLETMEQFLENHSKNDFSKLVTERLEVA